MKSRIVPQHSGEDDAWPTEAATLPALIPPEPQVPKRYCLLILRGCQTRFTNDRAFWDDQFQLAQELGSGVISFEYDKEHCGYVKVAEVVMPMVGMECLP